MAHLDVESVIGATAPGPAPQQPAEGQKMSDCQDTSAPRHARERRRPRRGIRESPGAITLLTLLFVAVKLTGHIDWSWWWVLSPLWIVAAVVALVLAAVFLFAAFTGKERKTRPG